MCVCVWDGRKIERAPGLKAIKTTLGRHQRAQGGGALLLVSPAHLRRAWSETVLGCAAPLVALNLNKRVCVCVCVCVCVWDGRNARGAPDLAGSKTTLGRHQRAQGGGAKNETKMTSKF